MSETKIHPSAIVHENAKIGAGCDIGPYCVIGENVTLGANSKLHSHVVLDGHTKLGSNNEVYPFTAIGLKTQDLKWQGGTTWTKIGDGNTIRENVTIHSATSDGDATVIGSHNNILAYCHIAHDCQLGDHIIMSNVGTLAGHVTVEDRAIIGGLAAVHQFCRIGTMAIIGGCSKVVQDVPPYMLADGNPASTRTINKEGLKRNGVSETAQSALKQAFKLLIREKLTIPNAIERIEADLPKCPELEHLTEFVRNSKRGIGK